MKGYAIRQAVVRIRSRQSLERFSADDALVPGSGNAQEKIEYVVVQRNTIDNKESPWKVWGTTTESDWKRAVV